MVKVTSLLIKAGSALGFSFGVGAQTDIVCVKGMHSLKVVTRLGFKGFQLINLNKSILCVYNVQ